MLPVLNEVIFFFLGEDLVFLVEVARKPYLVHASYLMKSQSATQDQIGMIAFVRILQVSTRASSAFLCIINL